ncbi:MAG TPA: polyphosphate kinase 1 [Polyangiaceae bacterium]|nr:polyphosphate kinase 1 [Polyangiaceae bacterium]
MEPQGNVYAPPVSTSQPSLSVPSSASAAPSDALRSPELYLNRELSWIEFNARVLAEGENEAVPLLERLKFLAIVSSNLDEFFMVRVAGLKQQQSGEVSEIGADGMTPAEQLQAVSDRVHVLIAAQYRCLLEQVLPALAESGVLLVKPEALEPEALKALDDRFINEIFPILTPIAIDPGHPFPHLRNKSLNLGVMFEEGTADTNFGVVQVPMMLPRLLEVPGVKGARHAYVLIEELIARHVGNIFPGVKLKGVYTFRVTRNFDIEIDEEEAEDLLQTIQQELRKRERGSAVRVEVSGSPTPASLAKLVRALRLDPDRDVYQVSGMLNVADLLNLLKDERKDMRDEGYAPLAVPPLRDADDPFAVIREKDVLLHHPYESFEHVSDLVARATEDPDVLAIKQTLYRAGGDSPIVKALARAAEAGKQVTAVVELKARFDEESNIAWARMLEQSGVNVVYGLMGLKTHAKCLLIIRRERGKLRRYVHLSTGNYNPTTARTYTDLSLFTARQSIGEDASSLFNLLTGYSAPPKWKSLIVAPLGLHEAVLGLIAREAEHARAGRPARIIAKMNALVDEDVIEALYRAAAAGVEITLLVRGICCLRPNVPGVSETIEVRAIVDRFLEHGRVFSFANGGKREIFIASADWMPRNFHRRVELMVPIEDEDIKTRLIEILDIQLADTAKSWRLRSDGSYERISPAAGLAPLRSQQRFIEMTRDKVKTADAAGRSPGRFHLARAMPARNGKGERTRRR